MKIANLPPPPSDHISHTLATEINALEPNESTGLMVRTFYFEQSFTATMAFFLQRLVNWEFDVAHQRPLRRCIPDILISLPPPQKIEHFAVSDGKNKAGAVTSTRLYSVHAWEESKIGNEQFTFIAFPFTRDVFRVELHSIHDAEDAAYIPIFTADIKEVSALASALFKLHEGIKIIQAAREKKLAALCPMEAWAADGGHWLQDNIYRNEKQNLICKVFHTGKTNARPNLEAIKAANCLAHVTTEQLSTSVVVLIYENVHGVAGKPENIGHFIKIAEILGNLHGANYVHSDIRGSNLIFGNETAAIIDFDYADVVGEPYQIELRKTEDSYRHDTVTIGHPRAFHHDITALLGFMDGFLPDSDDPVVKQKWLEVLHNLSQATSLAGVLSLQEFADIKVKERTRIVLRPRQR
eukprot:TRINITY_DN2716_c0_g2_i1.p1 TRINITY_DN2716_c0_g2~~TRINITY_DN2716_c0_g2_i1.p1  ORF type:complete len:457 (+),score=57.52 TRINITY_DN2716_c0_g2_i1:144-1373(+)